MKIRLVSMLAFAALLPAGDLTDRYNLNLRRVLEGGSPPYSPELILADVIPIKGRLFTEYSGDVSGRYVGALAASALATKRSFPELDGLVTRILSHQKDDGYFGAGFHAENIGFPESALLWGNGRLLTGLLEYYRLRPRPDVLAAARRMGDFLLRLGPAMNSEDARNRLDALQYAAGYICWTSDLEGVVALYRVTQDERYRRLAEQIVEFVTRKPGQHAHGYLSTVRGIVELYEATNTPKYLEAAESAWMDVVASNNVLVSGAVGERFAPEIVRTEGCTEADWLRLSLALWRLTGKAAYLEAAERTLFNEFALNEFSTGDFGARVLSSAGISTSISREGEGTGRAWWCCTLHGLRAFPDVLRSAFRWNREALYYDLPVDGFGTADGLTVTASSALATGRVIRIQFDGTGGGARALMIREPSWALGLEIHVNGASAKAPLRDGYRRIERAWKAGDVVDIGYAMRTRAVRNEQTGRIAVFHGPWLLGIDEELNPEYFNEPFRENTLEVRVATDGSVELERASAPAGASPFAVPAARFRVPYRHAGYPMLRSFATLRPVAEQTATRSVPWEWWLRIGPGGDRAKP